MNSTLRPLVRCASNPFARSVSKLSGLSVKKRTAVLLATGTAVFGSVYGFAASLNLTSNGLGAASTTVAACQAGTLNAAYAPSYQSSIPGYSAGVVTVSGLTSTCYSKNFKITLAGSGGTSLAEVTGTTPSTGSSFTVSFTGVSAASVTSVNLEIDG